MRYRSYVEASSECLLVQINLPDATETTGASTKVTVSESSCSISDMVSPIKEVNNALLNKALLAKSKSKKNLQSTMLILLVPRFDSSDQHSSRKGGNRRADTQNNKLECLTDFDLINQLPTSVLLRSVVDCLHAKLVYGVSRIYIVHGKTL